MTRMLASVVGPQEAETALTGGADIIDLKDPARGALGAVDIDTVRRTVVGVSGRRPVSAVTGEGAMRPEPVLATAAALADAGVDFVKQGIFDDGDAISCIRALASLGQRVKLVAVLFADREPDLALLPVLAEAGFAAVMLDTAEKSVGRLLDHMAPAALLCFIQACRKNTLLAGLAGALEAPDVPRLLVLEPDFLGFRGALCGAGGRTAPIDLECVQHIRALIPSHGGHAPRDGVDYRLLAARGYAHDAEGDPSLTDRIFVHDLILPVRIGAYARERNAPQRVRFSVDVLVSRAQREAHDMRDVFSYDIISDGIRLLVAAGHVPLVETLAERIAAMALAHPRVMKVTVQLEKLETGSGIVGVAIERSRAAAGAHGHVLPMQADAPGAAPQP